MAKGHIQVAAVPFRLGERGLEILLITSRESGRWIVPKGWPHKGLSLPDSAACEALEEAGITGLVSRKALGSYGYDKRLADGRTLACEVMAYPLLVDDLAPMWREFGQRVRQWRSIEEAVGLVEPALAGLLERLPDHLPELEAADAA
jgi:8-oxo-dGTP pyrophosphatase MutT (NUDIX family)